MSNRWGFEEDEWDEPADTPDTGSETDDLLAGADPEGIVTVKVTENVEVRSVTLAVDWKRAVDPRALHANVLAAMNAATMQALARQVEQVDLARASWTETEDVPATSDRPSDETPVTKEDAMRLVDAATADLEGYMGRALAIADTLVSVESAGGHITVSGKQRQVQEVTIDATWAGTARSSEIEAELVDVLREFGAESDLGELAKGPQSSAITELLALAADPAALVRRIARVSETDSRL